MSEFETKSTSRIKVDKLKLAGGIFKISVRNSKTLSAMDLYEVFEDVAYVKASQYFNNGYDVQVTLIFEEKIANWKQSDS